MRLTFDIETSKLEEYGRKGNPWGRARCCSTGWLFGGEEYDDIYYVSKQGGTNEGIRKEDIYKLPFDLSEATLLVGHNITFDLLYYWHCPDLQQWLKNGGKIWDTALAEYLLSGQLCNLKQHDERLSLSLKAVAKRRLPEDMQKLDIVATFWEQGYRTEDIHPDVLLEYQKYDVLATDAICVQQVQEARVNGMLPMIMDRMESLLASIEMTHNGLYVDLATAEYNRDKLLHDIDQIQQDLNTFLVSSYPDIPEDCNVNWNSNTYVSVILFGGELKYQVREHKWDEETGELLYAQKKETRQVVDEAGEPVVIKSGKNKGQIKTKQVVAPDFTKPKMRWADKFCTFPRITEPLPEWKNDNGYSVAAAVMQELAERDIPIVKLLQKYNGMKKDLTTYYYTEDDKGDRGGMLTMICPDGFLHHSLNHTMTVTTRLSSSKPNLQNLSSGEESEDGHFEGKSRVKEMFQSRFGEDGVVIEIDYSGQEVVTKAVLTGCPALEEFLLQGKDEHCEWCSFIHAVPYEEVFRLVKKEKDPVWIQRRKEAKPITFGEKYGAGAPKLSKESGIPKDTILAAMVRRRETYAVMYAFDDAVFEEVQRSRVPSPLRTAAGFQAGVGYWIDPCGTKYHFVEEDAPAWKREREGVLTAFKPTTSKNYPSQGLGGHVTQVAMGRLFRWLSANDFFGGKVKLINTVHDCIWFDCHKDLLATVHKYAMLIMQDTKGFFNAKYNTNWKLDFKAEFHYGPDMLHLSSYNEEGHVWDCVQPYLYMDSEEESRWQFL